MRVEVVASVVPVNHAVRPSEGRTGWAIASPCAQARRAPLVLPQLREGCTRLVSRIAKAEAAKSMTIEVPV